MDNNDNLRLCVKTMMVFSFDFRFSINLFEACINEQHQNDRQCRPSAQSGGSVCRQCCRGKCRGKFKALKRNWDKSKRWNYIMYIDFE